MELQGIPAAPGYAIGTVKLLQRRARGMAERSIAPEQVEDEIGRFRAGREAYRKHLETLRTNCRERGAEEQAAVLDGHLELLMDEELDKDVCQAIRAHRLAAEKAAETVLDEIIRDMEGLEDQYARERVFDFRDLKNKLIDGIAGESFETGGLDSPAIVVGRDVGPSDTAAIDHSKLLAVVSETGGATSHLAILSQNLGIPAVVAVKDAAQLLQDGDEILVDGCEGRVFVRPSAETIARFLDRQRSFQEEGRGLDALKALPAATKDGLPVDVLANVDLEAGIDAALRQGAQGIGLFRTEFLFFRGDAPPSEEDQFRLYCQAAARMEGRSVVFRTFDVGGDKPLAYLPVVAEPNPFLGWRGMRVYAEHPQLLETQLRAIFRAGHHGAVKVMFPMVTSIGEVAWLLAFVENVKRAMGRDGLPFNERLPIGIMIETPAAALIAEQLIEQVDFFSIGTNDLTQYTLAVDRGNEKIAGLYDPLHPAVLRLIERAIAAARARGKPISICGELAGDERATAILLGLGLTAFSVSPAKIPRIKRAVLQTTLADARSAAEAAMQG